MCLLKRVVGRTHRLPDVAEVDEEAHGRCCYTYHRSCSHHPERQMPAFNALLVD